MIRRPPRSTRVRSSAASDVYKRQRPHGCTPMPHASTERRCVPSVRDACAGRGGVPGREMFTRSYSTFQLPALMTSLLYNVLVLGSIVLTYIVEPEARHKPSNARGHKRVAQRSLLIEIAGRGPHCACWCLRGDLEAATALGGQRAEWRRGCVCLLYTSPSPRD